MTAITLNQLLNVAIVLAAVYASLSTVCSSIHERIAALLALRGVDLFRGILQLVGNDGDLAARIMNHPLINATSTKPDTLIKAGLSGRALLDSVRKSAPPSYVDARNFSSAIWQIVQTNQPARSVAVPAAGAAGANGNGALANAQAVANAAQTPLGGGAVAVAAAGSGPIATPPSVMSALSKAVGDMPDSGLKQSLVALLAAAGDDYDKLLRATDGWFSAQMDRVSGWYKRRTSFILGVIALLLISILGIDTLHVIQMLMAADGTALEQIVGPAHAGTGINLTDFANVRVNVLSAEFWTRVAWPGVLLTWLAVWLGGSFWFDVLSSLANVRAAGRKPKRSDQPPA